jgi:ubiquinone/menaquinone biosynthesis C-methylase UbiE
MQTSFFLVLNKALPVARAWPTPSYKALSMFQRATPPYLLVLMAVLSFAFDTCDREAKRLGELMSWRPGEVVAEIGAGEGQMSFTAAALVGAEGHVYSTELDEKKLAHLREEVSRRNVNNLIIVRGDPVGTNLPDRCCEAIFMRHVYHHFENPVEMDEALFRALKPGGLLAIIDFPPRKWLNATSPLEHTPPIHGGHGVPKKVLIEELSAASFEIVSEPGDWPNRDDYCVIARKPAGRK